MQSFRRILQKFHYIFQEHYPCIWFGSVFTLVLVGFLHFELKQNNKDLLYWKNLLQYCYQELEQFAIMLIMLMILVKIIFVGLIIMMNTKTVHWYDELTQLEVKKRYADFLVLRLIADIDKIEAKYLRNNKTSDIITLKSFILAHENMKKSVENFRKDARKLLAPNEVEITLPIEEVYGVLENEMLYVKRSRFCNMDIETDENVIKKLVNP
ncbi:uncharacterized protein LOC135955972 [Calliphora vicina]|uniref:uncharacterized protein LOC135955972 n=1 Tax=Calliphora vicina TaxID=7373 RepID=UPI00325AA004